LNFTEGIGEKSLIRIRFNPQIIREKRTRDTYKNNPSIFNQMIFDTLYSNSFENQNLALRGSISYRYNSEDLNFELDLMYQHHIMKGNQKFPQNLQTSNKFNAILPSFEINYRPNEFKRLRIEYNSRAQIPSITQLQNTIDFSNPNFLRTGNPFLSKVINHNFNIRYFITNPDAGSFNAYSANFQYSLDNISNNVIIFTKDTTLNGDILITKGTQLSYPVNIGNAFSFSINSVNSFKIIPISSNLSFSTTFNFSKTPNLINGVENLTRQYRVAENISLSSNSPQLDYRISYSPNFTYSISSLNRRITRILIHNANLSLKANLFNDIYLGSRISFYHNSAASNENDKSSTIINLSLSYLFLPNKIGELKFEVIDLLNQKKKVSRIIYEDYYEDRTTQQLERFFILSFTYNLRMFR
jgi:hypothetical protein